jgi:hypothetical protein
VSRQAAPGLEHDLLNQARLIVCVGTGGVGKTTTSAALALRAATLGRRTLVLTIDPAKRLANAMGLADLGNEAKSVDLGSIATATGSLDAMMLDAQRTFDDLIRRTAGPHASRILENRVYRIMVDQFAGTQEYMSLERLYDLYESNRWDLIVLDTPPSKNTLDFFESPRRAASMFDEQVMKWFVPAKSGGGGGLFDRIFNPGAVVLKLLSVIGGEKFIAELAEFFDARGPVVVQDARRQGARDPAGRGDALRGGGLARSPADGRGGGLPGSADADAQAGLDVCVEPQPRPVRARRPRGAPAARGGDRP